VSQSTSEQSIDARWRAQRQHNRAAGHRLRHAHRDHYEAALMRQRELLRKASVPQLLAELSADRGMMWADISRLLRVSVPALRKWRRDQNSASPENHDRLAGLVAFLRQLAEVHVADPAAWMTLPLDRDHTVTPRDVYTDERATALVDHAAGNISAIQLLDEVEPMWREKWFREFDLVIADDGHASLLRRTDSTDTRQPTGAG
jgi:hypothetical protein